jgi:DNA-binding response OmpR family regulator
VSSKRILVVDDDRTVLKSLKGILESEGYSVNTADKGRQALARFDSEHYDLVLLDVKLPDIDGTKLLRALHDRFPETVKVMVTGYPTLTNAVESLNTGADAYLMKPVNPRELLRVVEDRLRRREKTQDNNHEGASLADRGEEKPPDSTREEETPASINRSEEQKKPLDDMIERALTLLKNEKMQKKTKNKPRVRNVETKNHVTQVQKPQSPEQSFWFSLANLDLGNTGKSKKTKKEEANSKSR